MIYSEQLKSPLWQRKRLKIMERDNFQCKICLSESKTLNVHHFVYKSNVMAWDCADSILICLCEDCHSLTHAIQKNFNVEFVRFTPHALKTMYSESEYIKDMGLSFIHNYKNITSALFDYAEFGALAFESINENRTYVFNDILFDKENELVWINSFFDAK